MWMYRETIHSIARNWDRPESDSWRAEEGEES
jgi:hypothetical protein